MPLGQAKESHTGSHGLEHNPLLLATGCLALILADDYLVQGAKHWADVLRHPFNTNDWCGADTQDDITGYRKGS